MKITATVISVILVLPVAAYAFAVHLEYGWDASDLDIERIGAFDLVGVEGCVYGRNTLGRVCDLRLLPLGFAVESYEIVSERWEPIERTFTLGTDPGDGMVQMTADQAGGVQDVVSGSLLGYTVLAAYIKPLRVVAGRVSLLRDLKLRVNLRDESPDLRVRRRSSLATAHVEELLSLFTQDDVAGYRSWNVVDDYDMVTPAPSVDGGVADCVIITGQDLAPEFERLAAFHNKLGIRTVVRTTGWIESNYDGCDSPERIRNFIRHAYENWGTLYILLGGDPQVVPIRVLDYPEMISSLGVSEIASDIYYTNLEGNWNADGDEVIGEYLSGVDKVDRFPEVFAGRAAASTADEAKLFVDKTIHYMSGANPGVWQRRAVFLAQQIEDQLDGAIVAEEILSHFPEHFEKIRLYENYELYPGAIEETVENTIAYIDSGCNLVSHIGHGDEFRLDLGTDYMERVEIESLRSDTSYCFVYMMNCSSADPRVESVAKAFLKNPYGGAFAVLGNSELAYPGVGLRMEEDFFEYVFCEARPTIGAISGTYRIPHLSAYPTDMVRWWMYLNYILLGDPVVNLWVDEPGSLEVTLGGALSLEDSVYTVTVEDGGVGLEGAVVVLMGGRGEYGVGVSGVDGLAEVSYRPKGLGWVDVVVSHGGYIAHEDSVEVSGSGGRLYVSGVEVDDGGGWIGNGDGEVGWGERVGLGVGLTNGGVGVLSDVTGSLRVVEGCSLWVSVAIDDSVRSDSVVYVGRGGVHPGSMPFGLGIEDWVFGRYLGSPGHELGCWIWLDGMGWHVRFIGDKDYHSYACSLTVYGELLGYSGYRLESGDSVLYGGGDFVFGGTLDVGDFEDGLDLVLGNEGGVSVYDGTASYGSVGSSEVLGWYDVGFEGGFGDELGVWFEVELSSGGGGLWRDWFMVLAHDGRVLGERVEFSDLSGDTIGVVYGVRNVGSGGLRGLEGRLRGLSGVEVCDSVSAYGDLVSMGYVEGDGYKVRELGGLVRYEFELHDIYGRSWYDTVEVREVSGVSGVEGLSGGDYIELSWPVSGDSLLWGYDIYRSDSYGGPYELAGVTEGHSRYVDGGLLSEECYYYYVQARDSMGNLSVPSETLEIWTGPPYMQGWPAEITAVIPSSPVLGDLDGDGDLEVIIGGKDGFVRVWHHDGTLAAGWPGRTDDEIWSSAAVGNLDADPEFELVIGSNDGNIYAWNGDGVGIRYSDGFFKALGGFVKGAPALDDLDGDLDLEIVAANSYSKVYVWHHDGTGFLEPNGTFAVAPGNLVGSPTIADLDGDDEVEIIIGSLSGNVYAWHIDGTGFLNPDGLFATTSGLYAAVAAGDIDGNGDMELVIAGLYSKWVTVYNHTGLFYPGWPQTVDWGMYASPALADLDGDGKLDIIVGTFAEETYDTSSVYVFSDSGYVRPGWPRRVKGEFYSSAAVGDIDGDGKPDIVVGSSNGNLYAWHADGTDVNGWPRHVVYPLYSSPSIADLDDDGDLEIVIGGYDGKVHTFDLSAPYDEDTMEWPKLGHDLFNTGLYGGPSKSGIPGRDGEVIPRQLVLSGYPNPAFASVNIRLGIPAAGKSDKVNVDIYDVRGRHVRQVCNSPLEPGYHELRWDGEDKHDRRVASGIYFVKVSHNSDSRSRKIVLVR